MVFPNSRRALCSAEVLHAHRLPLRWESVPCSFDLYWLNVDGASETSPLGRMLENETETEDVRVVVVWCLVRISRCPLCDQRPPHALPHTSIDGLLHQESPIATYLECPNPKSRNRPRIFKNAGSKLKKYGAN